MPSKPRFTWAGFLQWSSIKSSASTESIWIGLLMRAREPLKMPKKSKKRTTRGQGAIYPRNGIWWCDYSVDGVRRRESCETTDRDEALAYLHRKQGRLAS